MFSLIKKKILACLYKLDGEINKPRVYEVTRNGQRLYLSNTVDITHWDKIDIGNNVFIWHNTIIDTFNGVRIGDGCQIGTKVGIFTHSSHISIRMLLDEYHNIYFNDHVGRVKGSVEIGDYCFIGANSIIMPETKIGRGSIVSAFSYVKGVFPDFSIISGNPARIVGDSRTLDKRYLRKNKDIAERYEKWVNGLD